MRSKFGWPSNSSIDQIKAVPKFVLVTISCGFLRILNHEILILNIWIVYNGKASRCKGCLESCMLMRHFFTNYGTSCKNQQDCVRLKVIVFGFWNSLWLDKLWQSLILQSKWHPCCLVLETRCSLLFNLLLLP